MAEQLFGIYNIHTHTHHIVIELCVMEKNEENKKEDEQIEIFIRRYSAGNLHFFFHTQKKKLPNLGSNSWFSLTGSYRLNIRLSGTSPST